MGWTSVAQWAGHQSVWSPASQDQVAGGHAGVGVVSLGGAPLALPTFASYAFQDFFRLGRAVRVTLPTGKGGVVDLFVRKGIGGAEEDSEKLQLTDKLLQAVLAEAQVVCTGQPLLIAGDLNADPAVIPCLAWTNQQSIVATSTAEAELHAGTRAATESMGVQAFARDLGIVPIRLHIGSSAALSIISRTGLGKAKDIEIQYLWLQETVRNNKLTVEKIPSETNSSDLGTKHLTSERSEMLMKLVNCFYL